jgi:hypothetical protein
MDHGLLSMVHCLLNTIAKRETSDVRVEISQM